TRPSRCKAALGSLILKIATALCVDLAIFDPCGAGRPKGRLRPSSGARKFAPCPLGHLSGRQLRHSGARENGRKSLPGQEDPQTPSGRHTCTPSGGLRNSAHFPGAQNLTTTEKNQTLRPSDRPELSSSPPPDWTAAGRYSPPTFVIG